MVIPVYMYRMEVLLLYCLHGYKDRFVMPLALLEFYVMSNDERRCYDMLGI
jgi:hypothetical protein